jgi:predicted dehydrogenase
MLMAKSCHDMDYLRYIVGKRCLRASSFGSLKHFKAECAPAGATDRCTTCPEAVETDCPYSALKIYPERNPEYWPVSVISTDHTPEGVMKALQEGPYGRCVYACDNDVVDHQVVNLEFEGGATAAFTMTAFNRGRGRETHIMGTRGELHGDGRHVTVFDFLSQKETVYDSRKEDDGGIASGHGGGDYGMAKAFVNAVAAGDPALVTSGPDVSLESHLIVFAAERARLNGTVEDVVLEK